MIGWLLAIYFVRLYGDNGDNQWLLACDRSWVQISGLLVGKLHPTYCEVQINKGWKAVVERPPHYILDQWFVCLLVLAVIPLYQIPGLVLQQRLRKKFLGILNLKETQEVAPRGQDKAGNQIQRQHRNKTLRPGKVVKRWVEWHAIFLWAMRHAQWLEAYHKDL